MICEEIFNGTARHLIFEKVFKGTYTGPGRGHACPCLCSLPSCHPSSLWVLLFWAQLPSIRLSLFQAQLFCRCLPLLLWLSLFLPLLYLLLWSNLTQHCIRSLWGNRLQNLNFVLWKMPINLNIVSIIVSTQEQTLIFFSHKTLSLFW